MLRAREVPGSIPGAALRSRCRRGGRCRKLAPLSNRKVLGGGHLPPPWHFPAFMGKSAEGAFVSARLRASVDPSSRLLGLVA